jgi:hypothetical protein
MTNEKVIENAADLTPVTTLPADYRTEYLGKRSSK